MAGNFEANLGGYLYKKRIRFQGQGKSGGGRTIVCYKKGDRAIFLHGFAKNEKSSLSKKELLAFKELSKILVTIHRKDKKSKKRLDTFFHEKLLGSTCTKGLRYFTSKRL